MNTEVTSGSRSLQTLNKLITVTLVGVALAMLAGVAAYLLGMQVLYFAAGGLAVVAAIPLFLMYQRVRAVENDIQHREALSLAQRKETERNQQAILRLLDELATARGRRPHRAGDRDRGHHRHDRGLDQLRHRACCATW